MNLPIIRLLILPVLLLAATPALAREAIGAFGDWGAFTDAKPTKACYAISQPSAPGTARGAYMTVTTWVERGEKDQVGFVAGMRLRSGSTASVRVGGTSLSLFTKDDGAWTNDADDDARLVAAMRRGNTLIFEATTSQGAKLRQTYSLRGISAALDAAQLACRDN